MKRFLYILLGIVGVAVILLAGYILRYPCNSILSFRCAAAPPATATNEGGALPEAQPQNNVPQTSQTGTPSGGTGNLSANQLLISPNEVDNFYVVDDATILAVAPDGKIIEIKNGQTAPLSDSGIADFVSASFSADGKKALVVFGAQSAQQASVFDIAAKTWFPLPVGATNPAWAPAGERIAYFMPKGDAKNLMTLDLSNPKAKPQLVLALHEEDLAMRWASSNVILLFMKGSAAVMGTLLSFDLKTKTVTPLLENRPGIDLAWTSAGEEGLVFISNDNGHGGKLALIDGKGMLLRELALPTLPEKCAFLSESAAASSTTLNAPLSLVCAVPRDTRALDQARLPDDYFMRVLFTADDFYKINLASGDIESLAVGQATQADAARMIIANNKLYFINRFDQKLYAISLAR